MTENWQRDVPVFDVPLWTRPFKVLCGLGALGLLLVLYREVAGLGPASGMNDAYAWGIWKTFNTMVLTALGSGAFAIGIAAWLFKRDSLHIVMRTACLTSFLAYAFGLTMLGIDVGRPWNFYWILMPWHWNFHSPLLEVAVCMTLYATVPLALENVPPILEWVRVYRPQYRAPAEWGEKIMVRYYPWIVSLAYVLPAMHQSSLGALMLLGGTRVSPLWQTPFLPLLYVWAAAFLGFSFVAFTLLFCGLMWNRAFDVNVLSEMSRITAWLIGTWTVFRFIDLTVRGQIVAALRFDVYALLFWLETIILLVGMWIVFQAAKDRDLRAMFVGQILVSVGGMLYRFDPTTLAFAPKANAFYFPSFIELVISLGFISIGVSIFIFFAKTFAILPASTRLWYAMEARSGREVRKAVTRTQYATGD